MIGRATAPVQPTARRLVQRVWGVTDIDDRQKWAAVWPAIAALPHAAALRMLDAGCGDGTWTIELADRRPPWRLIGIDRDPDSITRARSMAEQLSIQSASFLTTDFFDYQPDAPFDAVLSVASAHYLADEGRGEALFKQFARWLAPGGRLILYGPRRREDVLAPDDLSRLCAGAGLEVEMIAGAVHRMGTLAKQIRKLAGSSAPARAFAYPIELALLGLDRIGAASSSPNGTVTRSSALLLVARRPQSS
jgi:SAM-dependent methyltransferase